MSNQPILVTGFEPFGSHASNTSLQIVEALGAGGDPRLSCRVLPTSFRRAGELIESWIETETPAAVVMLGLAASAAGLRLERFATNRDDSESLDNDGELRKSAAIVKAAPEVYASTLPLERIAAAVRSRGTAVEFSLSAGGFVCNHVFYRARHAIERRSLRLPCGFLHVPATHSGQLEPWLGAVRECLRVLLATLE
ncbi:MAG TPA: hypothetical protein VFU02_08975 [Polyangiaceae bacterium]|nr:hypothetical protein [Polyangiaceae bacterium]